MRALTSRRGTGTIGGMKTTLDLPDDLMREVTRRARSNRQELQEAVAELLRKGLATAVRPEQEAPPGIISTDAMTGLPVIECQHAAAPGEEMTPEPCVGHPSGSRAAMAPWRWSIAMSGWRLAFSKHEFHSAARTWLANGVRTKPYSAAQPSNRFCATDHSGRAGRLRHPAAGQQDSLGGVRTLPRDECMAWADEPPGLEARWKKFAGGPRASPKQWMDAYLAAFAIAGGHQFVTTDRAFAQYKGLDLLVLTSKA